MEVMALSVRLKEEGAATVKTALDKVKASMKDLNLTSILAGAGLGVMVKQAIDLADQMRLLEGRLKLVTGSAAELQVVQDALRESANRTRSDYAASVELFARVARSTRDLGIAQSDLLRFTELTQMAIKTSGASSVEASAALIQLSQGLAAGTLRGEEFNSVMEQTPGLAIAIASGLGVGVGQLRAMAQQGQLTAQAVIDAVLKMDQTIRGDFASAPVTVADAFVVLTNGIRETLGEINAATGATSALARVMTGLVPAIAAVGDAIAGTVRLLREMQPLIIAFGAAWVAIKLPLVISTLGALGNTALALAAKLNIATIAQKALNLAMSMNPAGALIAGIGALTGVVLAFADASRRAAETRDAEIAKSPEYLAALEKIRERREAATKAEQRAMQAAKAAAQEAATRVDNLVKLAELTAITRGQYTELVNAERAVSAKLANGNIPLSQRITLLEQQKALTEALAGATVLLTDAERLRETGMRRMADAYKSVIDRIRELRKEMEKERKREAEEKKEKAIATVGISAAIPAPRELAGAFRALTESEEMQVALAQFGQQINDTLAETVENNIVDGLTSGIAAALSTGRIADAWKAMSQAIIQNLASAMVKVALAAIRFGTLMEKIRTFMVANPALAVASAAAMLAFAYANGGKAQSTDTGFTGGRGGGQIAPLASGMGTGDGTVTRLIFGQTSATTAAGMTPRQATNVTIIGPDDPKAQRAIEELIRKGQTRGTLG